MLAPVIQLLNEKGYRTTYCCSGHLFSDIYTDMIYKEDLDSIIENEINILYQENSTTSQTKIAVPYHITYEADINKSLYVSFKYDIGKFLFYNIALPSGFKWDTIKIDYDEDVQFSIRYYYKENEFFAFKKEQLEIIRRLYNWVKDLPIERS